MGLLDVLAQESSLTLSDTSEWAENFTLFIPGDSSYSLTGVFDTAFKKLDMDTGFSVSSANPRAVFYKTDVENIIMQPFAEDGESGWQLTRDSTGIIYLIAAVKIKNEYILQIELVKANA